MTREEALKYLKDFKDSYWDGMPEEALDMAIQALSQEPVKETPFREKARLSMMESCYLEQGITQC